MLRWEEKAIVIQIIKKQRIIGMLCDDDNSLNGSVTKVIYILENYNKNLNNTSLCNMLLAVRMFEFCDEFGNPGVMIAPSPILNKDSREFIEGRFPDFKVLKDDRVSPALGIINVTDYDMVRTLNGVCTIVTINLDTSYVDFFGTYYHEYEICNWDKNHKKLSELNRCKFDLSHVAFNDLEDLRSFVRDNNEGWLYENRDDVVVVPNHFHWG